MAGKKDLATVYKQLKKAACFSAIHFSRHIDESSEAFFLAKLTEPVRSAMQKALEALDTGGEHRPTDSAMEMAISAVLAPLLPPDLDVTVEIESGFGYRAGETVAPEYVELIVPTMPLTDPVIASAKPKKNLGAAELNALPPGEKKEALRRAKVRERAQRRRDNRVNAAQAKATTPRVGKVGYVERVYNERIEAEEWRATPAVRQVLREADRVWGKKVTSGGALAAHLNKKGLKPLGGATFKRNMMPRVILAVERIRHSRTMRRLHRTAG